MFFYIQISSRTKMFNIFIIIIKFNNINTKLLLFMFKMNALLFFVNFDVFLEPNLRNYLFFGLLEVTKGQFLEI